MGYHYSKDNKDAYQIWREHPECPIRMPGCARTMTSARIDFERVQDDVISWYEEIILKD